MATPQKTPPRVQRPTTLLARLGDIIDSGTDAILNIGTKVVKKSGKVVSKTSTYAVKKTAQKVREANHTRCEMKVHQKYGKPRNKRQLDRLNRELGKC